MARTAECFTPEGYIRQWTTQLYQEYRHFNWCFNTNLNPVVIQVADMNSNWGQWDSFFRTITINTRLIKEHSWDIVIEVLKHEMAHQYVDEVLSRHGAAKQHGTEFKLACKKLGVAGWACKGSGKIPDVIPTVRQRLVNDDDRKLLDRVEKLLSLAQSSNEHEAMLAMERVRELYAKHNLEKIHLDVDQTQMDQLILTQRLKKTSSTESKIFSILRGHFAVEVIFVKIFDAMKLEHYCAVEILGRRENILMAEFVYHFLLQQCDSLWSTHKKQTRCHGRLKRSFHLGVLAGFNEKLSQQKSKIEQSDRLKYAQQGQNLSALIARADGALRHHVNERFPKISNRSFKGSGVDPDTFSTGHSEGHRLNLNRPMSSRGGSGGYLTS